jgi:AcrR family transcriptional regulator
VAEALRQITSEDGAGMSLRRIAAALDTGPASLYAYVDDLRELKALVLDSALGAVDVGPAGQPWRERLENLLRSYAGVLSASPDLARLAFDAAAVGPNALRIAEVLLEVLDEAGVSRRTAAWAIDMLTLYMSATAAEHAQPSRPAAPGGPVTQAIDRVSASEYPRVNGAKGDIMSGTGDERFAWSVETLVQGILSHDRPRQRKVSSRTVRRPMGG